VIGVFVSVVHRGSWPRTRIVDASAALEANVFTVDAQSSLSGKVEVRKERAR
jgi:hypothetical protein